ncbi:MAG: hypothetical protein O3B46_05855 [Bacteroidetes bacterium]|nr:hypothetical protein [Bacteroidota bacterium]
MKWTRLIDSEETNSISQVYQLLLNEKAKTQHLRSDLSGLGEKGKEKITQKVNGIRVFLKTDRSKILLYQ